MKTKTQRTDYLLQTQVVHNGEQYPEEVYQFSEALRRWRAQSLLSNIMFNSRTTGNS